MLLLSATALGAPTNGAPIRSARELYRAMFAKSGATRTFALTATVSAVNFEDRKSAIELALADDTGSVGVIYEWSKLPVRLLPGDRIQAAGRITALHGWKRQNELTELSLLAHGEPPANATSHPKSSRSSPKTRRFPSCRRDSRRSSTSWPRA